MATSIRLPLVPFVTLIVLALLPRVMGASGACHNINITETDNIIIITNVPERAKEGECWELFPYDENLAIISQPHDLFRIDNGSLVLNRNLSLDGQENQELCQIIIKAVQQLQIRYKGRKIQVFLNVELTDDFPPRFNQTSYEVHIREHNDENQAVKDFTKDFIQDEDCDDDLNYNFKIKNSSDSSSFDISRNQIFVTSVLDYEKQQEYQLTVKLLPEDRNISSTLTVFVDDMDDENPYFGSQAYYLNVTEAKNLGNAWLSTEPPLWATDGDKGINDSIEYSVLDPVINVEVNSTTGEVRIKSSLDREDIPEYRITIKAFQTNNPLRSATATLTIHVQDVNDNLPEFSAKPQMPIKVIEGTPDGTLIIALPAEDKDEGENGLFSYELEDVSGAFDIKMDAASKTEWLFVNNSAAFNGTQIMKVKVILKPKVEEVVNGQPCDFIRTCVMELKFQIVDVNNYHPVFEKSAYIFSIQADSLLIGTISATDKDTGDNGNVTYTLELTNPSRCQAIQINPLSGILSISKALSNEQSCSFKVQACDNPSEEKDRRCSLVPVLIKVTKGLKSYYNVSVYEGIAIGSIILNLPEMDVIVKDRNFSIESGSLITQTSIDREAVTFLAISVYSSLDDSKQLSVVNIHVLDINDNAPIFTETVFRTNVTQNMNPGDKVIQVKATDADDGDNAELTYSLLNGRDWCSINNITGFISITKQPLFGDVEKISLHVQVTDGGSPALSSTAVVVVYSPLFSVTASLILPLSVSRVKEESRDITRFLSDTLMYKVTIEKVESLPCGILNWSKLLISAKRKNGKPIARATLESMIKNYAAEIEAKYNKQTAENGNDEEKDDFKIPFIIVVCIAAVLLLIILVSLLIVSRKLKRYRQNASILNKLNTDKAIYDNAGKQDNPMSERIDESPELHAESGDVLVTQDTSSPTTFVNPSYSHVKDEVDGEGEKELTTPDYDNVREHTSLNQNENVREFDENSTNLSSDNTHEIGPSFTAAVIDVHENADIQSDSISNRVHSEPAHLYPNLHSLEREEEDQSGTGSNTDSLPSQDIQLDFGKNSDADSGVPSDKDGADDDDNDDNTNSLEDEEILSGIGAKAKKDFDKPSQKEITVGLTSLEDSRESEPLATDNSKNPEEPEPDYGKKVRFEEFGGNSLVGNDTNITTEEKTDDGTEDPNIRYFLETEVTAL